jgi:hypothetical protein
MMVLMISISNKSHKNFQTLTLTVKKISSNRHQESGEDKLETEGLRELLVNLTITLEFIIMK